MSAIDAFAAGWLAAKEEERAAVEKRREYEDAMRALAQVAEDKEGVTTIKNGDYVIKLTSRIDRKVDSDLLQEIAAESGLTEHLSNLFRWKPEINASAWKNADASITRALSGAITAKPGRPSFQITKNGE